MVQRLRTPAEQASRVARREPREDPACKRIAFRPERSGLEKQELLVERGLGVPSPVRLDRRQRCRFGNRCTDDRIAMDGPSEPREGEASERSPYRKSSERHSVADK